VRRISDTNFRIVKGDDTNMALIFIIVGLSNFFGVSILHGFVHKVVLVHHIGNIYA
jgi:hypothetical protein